jgi:hypothetical protein
LALPQLPLTLPVTVQLIGSDSPGCWEATFTSASKNDATQFKAKSE